MSQTGIHPWVRGLCQSPAVRAEAGRAFEMVRPFFVAAILWVSVVAAHATQVVVGQVAPLTGAQSGQAREYAAGMQALFGSVNDAGLLEKELIAAKTIVEAVRRQGWRPSPEGMSVALDGIEGLDLGGHVLGYKAGRRSGSRYVELTIITDTGKIRH